ncbi:MAG: DUF4878 domain-containing protein, partial [Planctomycetota bacterium]|nr:DUF4878 domain-containing protein [Planctomycetota bacterium]
MKSMYWMFAVCGLVMMTGCSESKVEVPGTPDGTIVAVAQGLDSNQPEVIWAALPEKHKKDVKDLIVAFADQADQDVYEQGFAVFNKAGKLLASKKEFILNHPMVAAQKESIAPNYDVAVALFSDIGNSDIKTLEGLKKTDPGTFLADTGSKVMKKSKEIAKSVAPEAAKNKLDSFSGVKATVVKSEGDKATVKVTGADGKEHEEELTKIDGKWLPTDLVEKWDDQIKGAKEAISKYKLTPEQKTQALDAIKQLDATLDKMLAANSQDEFNAAVGEAMSKASALP